MSKCIGSLTPYFGCKREKIAKIVPYFGEHAVFWDICCGSLASIFGKEKSRVEVCNDLNGAAINLSRVVQHDELSVKLFEKLNRTLFCEGLFEDSRNWLVDHDDVLSPLIPNAEVSAEDRFSWAYHYFLFSWQARNGFAGTKNELKLGFCRRFTSNGGDPAVRFRNAVESIPEWWERLRGVTLLQEDCLVLCKKIEDKVGTVIYADFPYVEKGVKYLHDFDEAKHRAMAKALSELKKTKVVISYYEHPLLTEIYNEVTWEMVCQHTNKKAGATGKGSEAKEILLVNRT